MDKGINFLDNMSKIVLPCVAGLTLINTRRDIYLLAWTIVGSLGYVAYDLNMSYFSGFNRLQEVGFGGMDNNSLTIGFVAGVGFAFFLGLSETTLWRRYLAFAAAAFMTHCVFFSFSRGGMLGLVFVGMATAILIPKTPKNLWLVALGASIALMMAGPEVVERFSTVTNTSLTGASEESVDSSAESRVQLWRICLKMTMEDPVFGKGPDHFPLLVQNYPVSSGGGSFTFPQGKEAHTLWLQIAAELGLPGLAFLAAYYVLTVAALWKYTRLDKSDSAGLTPGAAARMVCAALVGFILSAQFVSLEGLELPYYMTLVGLGSLKLDVLEEAFASPESAPEPQVMTASPVMARQYSLALCQPHLRKPNFMTCILGIASSEPRWDCVTKWSVCWRQCIRSLGTNHPARSTPNLGLALAGWRMATRIWARRQKRRQIYR